ncbi:MAG: galactose-1-phosphate uridylyltransferase [Elusimicrobia bacterium]|nr:galactose-1-phosphate uridylyltransferase [Elusimicrobiota bacterium]
MPELRRDPVEGRWVIISTERGKRPSDFGKEPEEISDKLCPFCSGNEDKTPPEILAYHNPGRERNKPGWWVRVVPNKFPALQIEGQLNRQGDGMYDKMHGLGAHEVIIETPDHTQELSDLEDKRVEDVIWAYRDRIMDLKKDPRFAYILVFKNRGAAAGASLSHPHSQLIATPVVPKRVQEEVKGAKNYFEYKERCVFCDMIKQELNTTTRIVAENDDFLAFEPFASRFPFETWVIPKVHDSDFEDIQKHEAINLSHMLKAILEKIDKVLDQPPFNYILHNSPLRENRLPHYHWHIEIMPRLTKVAGFEWGTGFYINPTPPEEAARFLREAE